MLIEDVASAAIEFQNTLDTAKRASPHQVAWYPYQSLANFEHFANRFTGEGRNILAGVNGSKILDVGAADGATSFFLEAMGAEVTIVDNRATNFNNCDGIRALTAQFGSGVKLIEQDLDFTPVIQGQYDLAMFLGILYHLRNPILVLNSLASAASRMVVSTLVCSRFPRSSPISALGDPTIDDEELAFLLRARAYNDDPTNYWVMTPANMRTVLARSGWIVLDEFRVGDVGTSRPGEGDQRMFCYCERHPGWASLRDHHDF